MKQVKNRVWNVVSIRRLMCRFVSFWPILSSNKRQREKSMAACWFWRQASALACILALFSLEIRGETGAEQWDGGAAEEDVGACGEQYERYWACRDEHEYMHPSDALSACAAPFAAVEACRSAPANSQDVPPKNDEKRRAQEQGVGAGGLRMALLQPKHWEVFDVDGEVSICMLAAEDFDQIFGFLKTIPGSTCQAWWKTTPMGGGFGHGEGVGVTLLELPYIQHSALFPELDSLCQNVHTKRHLPPSIKGDGACPTMSRLRRDSL